MDGADRLSAFLHLVLQRRDAEVGDLYGAVLEKHDILRLNVAVDYAAAVRMGKRLCYLLCKMQRFLPAYRAALVHILLERDAVYKFHDYVFDIVAVADVIHGDYIRMREHGDSVRFGAEAALELLVGGHLLAHYLHGHKAAEPVTERLVDDGHSALAYFFKDLVSVVQQNADIVLFIFHKQSPTSSQPEP